MRDGNITFQFNDDRMAIIRFAVLYQRIPYRPPRTLIQSAVRTWVCVCASRRQPSELSTVYSSPAQRRPSNPHLLCILPQTVHSKYFTRPTLSSLHILSRPPPKEHNPPETPQALVLQGHSEDPRMPRSRKLETCHYILIPIWLDITLKH